MVRRILVPLEPSEYSVEAVKMATLIARQQDAEVTGIGVVDVPGIEKNEGGAPAGAIYYAEKAVEHRTDEARRTVMELFARFRETCDAAGVRHRETELMGDPVEQVMEEARYHDLIVTGLRSRLRFATEEDEKKLDELLDATIVPVLAVPKQARELRSVLIAYDGSLLAARSLQRFAHLTMMPGLDITVLCVDDDEDRAKRRLSRAEEYLRVYGAQQVRTVHEKGDVVKIVEEEYLPRADLVVLGAHSKVPFVDFFVGSLVKKLIEVNERPLFIGQ